MSPDTLSNTSAIYDKTFEALKLLQDSLNLSNIMVNFEQDLHKVLEKAFRATYLRGCLFQFHYCQAVYRKVVEFGFLADYKDTNSDIRLGVRRLLALPFLPEDDVEQSFEELKERHPATLQPIVDYFSRTWIADDAIFSVQL